MPRTPRGTTTPRPTAPVKPRAAIESPFICCPMCCMSRKLEKTGAWAKLRHRLAGQPIKGLAHFGKFDLDRSFLIQIRDCSGSRGHGFPTIGGYTIDELKQKPEFAELLSELRESAQRLLDKLSVPIYRRQE